MLPPLASAPFSGKAIAPYLDPESPERAEACRRLANLFYEMRNGTKEFNAASHVLEPLLRLLPHDESAAEPLATMASVLTAGCAYPEALRCIEAVIDHDPGKPLGHRLRHADLWKPTSNEPMTWPRERALLTLYRGECLLAQGDEQAGEEALAEGTARAAAAEMPVYFRISPVHSERGTTADYRALALTRAARAIRFRLEGKDVVHARKLPKKRDTRDDGRSLELARSYVEKALAAVMPRVAVQYAGLVPWDYREEPNGVSPELTRAQKDQLWQAKVLYEAGMLDERAGDLVRARHRLGQGKHLLALALSIGSTIQDEMDEAVRRLGVVNVSLDA
jgi:hypothetical protein